MFVGHLGLAYLTRGMRRDAPLLLLVASAYLPDLVRFALQPFSSSSEMLSHSIPAVAFWALAIGAAWAIRGGSRLGMLAVAVVCLLHWPADVFTGCKPTLTDGPWVGFFSYRWPLRDLLVELSLVWGGWLVCRRRIGGTSWAYRWWVPATASVLQLAFLVSMYANAQFFIGRREWNWLPREGLLTLKRVPTETMFCRPPVTSPPGATSQLLITNYSN